jgi:hypothetical protein
MSTCLDADALERWVDGSLSDAERSSALAHIADCSACRQAISALAQLDTRFGERAETPPPSDEPTPPTPRAAPTPRAPALPRAAVPGWIWIVGGAVAGAAVVAVAIVATRSPAAASSSPPLTPTATPIEPTPLADPRSSVPLADPRSSVPLADPRSTTPPPSMPPMSPAPTTPTTSATSEANATPTASSETRAPTVATTSASSDAKSAPTVATPAAARPQPIAKQPEPPTGRPLTIAWGEQAMAGCVWSAKATTRYLDHGPVEKREGRLYAIAGQRGRYVIDANEHAAGTLVANVGDLVALCPIAASSAELPVGWGGQLWKTVGFARIAAAPGLAADGKLVHASSIAQLMDGPGAWRLHASTRVLLPMTPTGVVEEDRHEMGGWWLEIPAGTPGENGARRWVVATFARFTPLGDGRPVPVLHAIEIRAGLLGP